MRLSLALLKAAKVCAGFPLTPKVGRWGGVSASQHLYKGASGYAAELAGAAMVVARARSDGAAMVVARARSDGRRAANVTSLIPPKKTQSTPETERPGWLGC